MRFILIPLIVGVALGYSVGYAVYQPQMSKAGSVVFEEPSPLSSEPKNLRDLKNDLGNLGCKIVYFVENSVSVANGLSAANYTEFRKVAYNSKVVFLCTIAFATIIRAELYTVFNGAMVNTVMGLQVDNA